MNRKKADMTKGPILGRILPFALPIFIGSVFQMLYNMVDSIIVGRYVGANALAAVGSTATISMVLVGVASGFTTESNFFRAFKAFTGMTPKEWTSQYDLNKVL